MKYILRVDILGNLPEIEISESEYLALCSARNSLSNALAIEAKYEMLISNYLEFEREVFAITADHMIRNQYGYSDSFNIHLRLNIRLVNLLTAARLYVDQLNQNAAFCMPDDLKVKDKIKIFFSNQYDNNSSYRFMEALRNYVQHQDIPVHWTSHGCRLTSLDADGLVEFSMEVCSVRSYFEKNNGLKKRVLDELEEKIDLKASTRSYIESISQVHHLVRDMISQATASSRSLIEDTRRRYAEIYGKEPVGLVAYKLDGQKKEASISLLLDWDDVRVSLQKRNGKLTNLSKRYVTGAVKSDKKAN